MWILHFSLSFFSKEFNKLCWTMGGVWYVNEMMQIIGKKVVEFKIVLQEEKYLPMMTGTECRIALWNVQLCNLQKVMIF